MWIIISGKHGDKIPSKVTGPFKSAEAATAWAAENLKDERWVVDDTRGDTYTRPFPDGPIVTMTIHDAAMKTAKRDLN